MTALQTQARPHAPLSGGFANAVHEVRSRPFTP